jgi:transposase-like protein
VPPSSRTGRSIRSSLKGDGGNGERKYYTPEFKEQAVKMVVGLDCTYDLFHAL